MPEIHPVSVLLELAGTPSLGTVGAELLGEHRNPAVRASALHHPATSETTRSRSLRNRYITVQRAALATTTDPTNLEADETTPVEKAVGIAANTRTRAETLARLLTHPSIRVVREAMSNPSSPSSDVVAAAGRYTIGEVFAAGVTSLPIAGTTWVVDAHPEVARTWAEGPSNPALRVLAYQDTLEGDVAEILGRKRRGGWIRSLVENPATPEKLARELGAKRPGSLAKREALQAILAGESLRQAAADPARRTELTRAKVHAADRVLCQQDDLGYAHVVALVLRDDVDEQVEGKALAALVNRHGGTIAGLARETMSSSRLTGIAHRSPLVEHVLSSRSVTLLGQGRAETIATVLGNDRGRWEAFLTLLPDWSGSPEELAETTSSL